MAKSRNYVYSNNSINSLHISNDDGCLSESFNSITLNVFNAPAIPVLNYSGSYVFCEGEEINLEIVNGVEYGSYQWIFDENQNIGHERSIPAEHSGEYKVRVSDQNNCEAESNTTRVTIYGELFKPEIAFLQGAESVCPEEVVTLMVEETDERLSYHWKYNGRSIADARGQQFNVIDEGSYTVEVSAVGCQIESDPISVTYKESLPKPEIIAKGSNIWYLVCSNDSANNYKWFLNDELIAGEERYIYVADQIMGQYRVAINGFGECFTSSNTISIPDGNIVGIPETAELGDLLVYPNPTTGILSINMKAPHLGDLFIDVFNESGKRILSKKVVKHTIITETSLNLSNYSPGLYLVKLRMGDYTVSRKVVLH